MENKDFTLLVCQGAKKDMSCFGNVAKKYDSQFARDRSSEVSCAEDNQYYTIHNSIYSTIGF